MFTRFTALVALTLAAASPVLADHLVTITNNCGNAVTPMLTNTGGPFVQLATLGRGQSTTTILAEGWYSGRIFGQTGQCGQPDGGGCTLLECDFSNPNFRQCNLSRVSGYNVGMSFSFDAGNCGGNSCESSNCGPDQAFTSGEVGGNSLRQCNNPGVGMHVSFC